MKRVFLALLSFCLCNLMYAQANGKLTITDDKLQWDCPNQIVCNDKNDTVYIAFGKHNSIKLEPMIADDIKRDSLSKKLKTEKNIFIQIGGKENGTDFETKNAGYLANDNGGRYNNSYVIIKKEDLPLKIIFENKEINIIEFLSTDMSHCEIVRNRANAYKKLPDCKKDTISINKLSDISYSEINLGLSSAWTAIQEYRINNKLLSSKDGKILIPQDVINTVKSGDRLNVMCHIEFKHSYFSHERDIEFVEIYVKSDDFWWGDFTKLSWKHLLYLLLLLTIIILIICRKKICMYLDNNKKKQRERIQQKYIEEIVNNKGSEEKLDIVKKLLSNEDIEFKTNIAGMLNIETPPHIDELKKEIENQKNEINVLSRQVATLKEDVITLENEKTSLENEKTSICSRLNNLTFENKVLAKKNSELEQTVNQLHLDVNGLKLIIANKDKQIELCLQRNKTLKDQLVRISRQNMYLLQIDDALKEASDEILNAFSEVEDGDLKKKLVLPLLNGVAGLDDGITTYYNRWQKQVMAVQNDFFGKDLYEMSDDEVKYKLVSGFLKNLAQGDTFSKLTRLYMYIQADWINEILIKNKFNVDKVEQIFNRLKMLFNEFGIEIIYPRLFVDHMDEQQYTFDPRCEVFKLFPISEDMRILYSKQTDLIIDIVQIGVKIPAEQYSRKAIVSIPNF